MAADDFGEVEGGIDILLNTHTYTLIPILELEQRLQ